MLLKIVRPLYHKFKYDKKITYCEERYKNSKKNELYLTLLLQTLSIFRYNQFPPNIAAIIILHLLKRTRTFLVKLLPRAHVLYAQ